MNYKMELMFASSCPKLSFVAEEIGVFPQVVIVFHPDHIFSNLFSVQIFTNCLQISYFNRLMTDHDERLPTLKSRGD